ncbi:hypothetical protein HPB50_001310 [Hyalomma asiaticum]|uniref:Uncharacterized protein n=1 Tax=Hyalomma asiaticum TaxID=266040 RepID=A0ACB7SGS2_HYAAI|nr:hypothetical protein HPB50_001310 [Hyalomma asiaticum]
MDFRGRVSLGEKLGLSGDALRMWIEELNARETEWGTEERDARREQAECEERAREAELTFVREKAALEERNLQLSLRLVEAENAANARASLETGSVGSVDRGAPLQPICPRNFLP